jgi:hypothetical protein
MEMRATNVLLAYAWAALLVLFLPLLLLYIGTWALKRLSAVLFIARILAVSTVSVLVLNQRNVTSFLEIAGCRCTWLKSLKTKNVPEIEYSTTLAVGTLTPTRWLLEELALALQLNYI